MEDSTEKKYYSGDVKETAAREESPPIAYSEEVKFR
jgi:hypothetical protein